MDNPSSTIQIAFRAPRDLVKLIDERAELEQRTRSKIIIRLLAKVLGKKTK